MQANHFAYDKIIRILKVKDDKISYKYLRRSKYD